VRGIVQSHCVCHFRPSSRSSPPAPCAPALVSSGCPASSRKSTPLDVPDPLSMMRCCAARRAPRLPAPMVRRRPELSSSPAAAIEAATLPAPAPGGRSSFRECDLSVSAGQIAEHPLHLQTDLGVLRVLAVHFSLMLGPGRSAHCEGAASTPAITMIHSRARSHPTGGSVERATPYQALARAARVKPRRTWHTEG
jgi:hypothetical protein